MKHQNKNKTSTLDNALKLLTVFTWDKPEVSIEELQKILQIGKSTVYRLIHTLLKEGMLVKVDSHSYRLSYTILYFGNVVASQFDTNNDKVLKILQELVNRTGETGYIGTMHGIDVVYIQKIDSKNPIRLLSYLGKRNPTYCTSSGRSILAHQNKEIIDLVKKDGFYPYTEKTISTANQLDKLLDKVRRNGYDLSIDEFHKGVSSIGAPIVEENGQVRYSVNIVGPNKRISHDKIPNMTKHVLEASEKISSVLKQRNNKFNTSRSHLESSMQIVQTVEKSLNTVSNAIRILRLFTIDHPEWGVREISRLLNINKTTVHRLITALSSWGFLEKNQSTNRYKLGIQFLTLSGNITKDEEIHREALPVLQSLVNEVGETALIGVLEENEVNYIHKVESPNSIPLRSYIGKRHPAHCTGSGKVMLAYQPKKVIEQILNNGLPKYTSKTITDEETFKKNLTEIQKVGYAISIDEIYEGIASIGLPIFDYSEKVIASLTIVGSKARMNPDKINVFINEMQKARNIISEKLGYFVNHT